MSVILMNNLISVIVPFYNVQNYIGKCIESIINQTYKNLEIICVNDGSTDSSGCICEKYKKKDSRIKIIYKSNGGLSDARNAGIQNASGKYLTFIDSDDYVSLSMIEHLINILLQNHADISICDPVHIYPDKKGSFTDSRNIKLFRSQDAVKEMLYQKSFLTSAWAKLYDRKLFENILFPKGQLFEDSAVMYRLFEKAEMIVYSDAKYYAYNHRTNSITTSLFSLRDLDILDITDEIEKHYAKNPELMKAARSYKISACFRIVLNAPQKKEYENAVNKSGKYIRENWKEILFDSEVRSKTKIAVILYIFFKPVIKIIYRHVDRWK